jgi:hypothetical protein
MRHSSIFLLILALLSPMAVLADDQLAIPLPREYTDAKALMDQIQHSPKVDADTKDEVQRQFRQVEAQFNQGWTKTLGTLDRLQKKSAQVAVENERLKKEEGEILSSKPSLTDESGVAAYNSRVGQHNAAIKAQSETASQMTPLQQELQADAAKVDAWLHGPELTNFTKVATGVLSGKIRFHKGQAWQNLIDAANKLDVFDGSGRPLDTHASGDPVDARDVKPWAPGEREKELKKSQVQPPRHKKTEPPPPPR